MHVLGDYVGASRSLEGDMIISFAIDDTDLSELQDQGTLVLDISKFNPKRSISANNYFWKLCTEIAKVIKSDKDTVYLIQLSKYGVWVDMDVIKDALPTLRKQFRYVEELDDGLTAYRDTVTARCYFGSSTYDTAEMSQLIDGTVRDAHDLGIQTWSEEEIEMLIKNWRG